jgi:UDP-N-acetylmuramoyl-tripeptide--D-alanyl-D-alanine ligase
MGANHVGEIDYLRKIAEPDIAIVTNTLDAHIGEFGGFENLVKTKGEIYSNQSTNIFNTSTSFSEISVLVKMLISMHQISKISHLSLILQKVLLTLNSLWRGVIILIML